ncbi:MAG TPA: copper resistance protein CopC [Gaiellaceae bacterium]|nr:copper resistance protein CopC [Gaiellaceae bacterium]
MRRLLALAAGLGVALALPASAFGHAIISSASPATQAAVAEAPTEIRLEFNQPVTVTPRSIEVLAADGTVISGAARVEEKSRAVVAPVSGLVRGSAYTVRWRVVGRDGHSPSGVYTFGIGVNPPPPTAAVGARGTTWKDDAARWALFAALALVIGPLVVRLAVLRGPVPDALERRVHLVTTVAAVSVINVGIAAFVIRASNALQLPLADLLYGDLQPFAEKTRFGLAFLVMTVGFALVAALLMLAWIFDLAAPRWWALGLSIALVSGLSLAGHQGTEPNASRVTALADWLHLVAASVWVGGVATLALLVWPAAPGLRARAFIGFSRIAVGLVGAMVLAGAYLAIVRLPGVSDLWQTDYGRMLLVKLGIVALALSWGGIHHVVVRPRLEAGRGVHARPSLVGETVVAMTVLLAAAVLTNVSPPPVDSGSGPAASAGR